jgi:alginate O-acetyltransferase complex protein AlgI
MLFNSFEFLLVFLPVSFGLFYLIGARNRRAAAAWLTAASLFFYGWWEPAYLLLLVASIAVNFAFGLALVPAVDGGTQRSRDYLLFGAIVANLLVLGYFKYAGFVIANVNALTGTQLVIRSVVLPLGISFFTFTQIAFLVDTYRGYVRELNLLHYVLFVTYFPHLIAGPVLHHKEMMPQFAEASTYRLDAENVAVGLTALILGLFKKVVLADGIAAYATPVFDAAEAGVGLTLLEAWGGVFAYSFQIYFDFSGYSDMAVGISRMFGVRLPINFYSPYQAHNIIEFWRRWHMTLSRFLRDYLYIPLGGNRRGSSRRYANMMITMLLGGLWHGASWTFAIWGGLHGLYLAANHGWRAWRAKRGRTLAPPAGWRMVPPIALTFFAATVAWVFFRASTLPGALSILESMFGLRGLSIAGPMPGDEPSLATFRVDGMLHHHLANWSRGLPWLVLLAAITWFAPNTQQILDRYRLTLDGHASRFTGVRWRWYAWSPRWTHAVWCAALATTATALILVGAYSEFIYFQF